MASDLAPLVYLTQGCVESGTKMLVLSSPFLMDLQLYVAIVMMIVAISGQSINCRLNVVVRTCMGVRETFMCGILCWWVHCKL